jgi:VWD domain-containing protein
VTVAARLGPLAHCWKIVGSALRRLLVLMTLCAGLLAFAGRAEAAEPLELSVGVAEPTFAQGEPIRLTATITNHTGSSCLLSNVADGTLRVVGVTRDGEPVSPRFGAASYLDGYTGYLRQSLTDVAAGKSVRLALDATVTRGTRLAVAQPLPSGAGMLAAWPLDEPGAYRVSMIYQVPQLPRSDRQPCAGASGVSEVDFTVTAAGARATGGWHAWGLLVAVGGVVVLALVVVLVAVLRRRGRRAGVAALVVVLALGMMAGQAPRASADVASRDADLNGSVQTCLDTIRKIGGPSAEIVKYFEKGMRPIAVTRINSKRAGQDIYDVHNYAFVQNGYTIGTIWWNPLFGPGLRFSDNVAYDPCAALLHELAHIHTLSQGKYDGTPCSAAFPVPTDEVIAMQAENTYRKAAGLEPRTTHNDDKVPPDVGACDHQPSDKDKSGSGKSGCSGLNATCGRTRGDPHLTTFDDLSYDFQAAGEFVAARSADGSLEVQTRQTPAFGSRTVTVNTAVAARIGRDKISMTVVDGQLVVRTNGRPVTADTSLPDGGTLARRDGWSPYATGGWTASWPDGSTMDVDPFGDSWLDVSIAPAPALAGKLSGLLGDFDGNADDDLAPRTGHPLPRNADFGSLYRTFGDSWRVDARSSLFDYQPGENTDTFTDRTVPAGPADDLPADARAQAKQVCARQGVTDPALLDACVIDVAHTGQVGFVVASAVTQRQSAPATDSGAIRDGDAVTGQVDTAGGARRHDLDLGGATDFYVANWKGPGGACDQAFSVNLVGVSGNNLPCAGGAVRFHVPDPAGRYELEIAAVPGRTGTYAFTLITVKTVRARLAIGASTDGTIDTRGEEHRLEFDPGGLHAVRLTGLPPCPSGITADLYDLTTAGTVTGRGLCGSESTLSLPDPAHRYALVVRSETLTTGRFQFTLAPA